MQTLTESYFNPVRGVPYPLIDESYARLEETGFRLDVGYLNTQAEKATEDERLSLEALRVGIKDKGFESKSDEFIDSIWSSPTKLSQLLHGDLGLSPSPIWKKGEVPLWKGETKTDSVAIEYLANANPSVRALLKELLNLKRIRSSLKYLNKLPTFVSSDGLVHPVYGPSQDDDESSGTNTGRTVMKNPEGQQIPTGEDKDPYLIRKGFIAPDGMVLVVRDYSAMEAVILHAICVQLFDDYSLEEATSSTFHAENARLVFGNHLGWRHPNGRLIKDFSLDDFKKDPYLKDRRKDAKTIFYGLQFCKGARSFGYTLLDSNGIPIGESIAKQIVNAFLNVRTGLKKFQDFMMEYLQYFKDVRRRKSQVVGITDFVGRARNVEHLLEEFFKSGKIDWRFYKAWRQSCNHPCQSGGANIKGAALYHCLDSGIVVQNEIHDEFIARCKREDAEEVNEDMKYRMENTFELPAGVKLKTSGSIGDNWEEAK